MDANILILLVEDEFLVGLSVQDTLEDGGFSVHHVESGQLAIEAIENDDLKVCAVVTDIRLGSGPDGWAVARRAREVSPHMPILYLSGDSAHEHSSRGVPNSRMIQKPFAGAQVVTAISTLLNEAQTSLQ